MYIPAFPLPQGDSVHNYHHFHQILKGVCDSLSVWEPLLQEIPTGLDEKTRAGKTFEIMESIL